MKKRDLIHEYSRLKNIPGARFKLTMTVGVVCHPYGLEFYPTVVQLIPTHMGKFPYAQIKSLEAEVPKP